MNIGVQFKNMQSEDGSFTLDDKFFGVDSTEGDQVVQLDATAWDVNTYDKQGVGNGWYLTPAGGGAQEFMASLKIAKGDFLYYIPADAEGTSQVPVSGQVAASGEQSVTFEVTGEEGAQWMFPLCNPFPINTTWGDLNAFTKEGDQIVRLDAVAWDVDTFDRQGDGNGWYLTPAGGGAQELINAPESVAIPAGGSVYYIPVETVTWTVTL